MLVPAVVLSRLLNNPDSLGELDLHRGEWNDEDLRGKIKARRDRGEKILNAAYLITTCGVAMDKVDYIMDIASAVERSKIAPVAGQRLESFHGALMQFKGLGSFLAAQVVADLKNTSHNALRLAPDLLSWCAPGPGSRKGLQAVLGGPVVSDRHFLAAATQLYADTQEYYGAPLDMCMQNFQNCLCEFSKYFKAYYGLGKPKQRYSGW